MPKMLVLNPAPTIPLGGGWFLRATKGCRGPKGVEFLVELLDAHGVVHDTQWVRKSELLTWRDQVVERLHTHEGT
jgi:hypothetical protein